MAGDLFMAGQLEGPYKRLTGYLEIGPNARSRRILMWITYYHTGIDDAIRLGDELRSQHLQDNPIL